MQTRHQTDMNNKRGREEHEEIGHDAKRIAVDQHPIASHVAVAPDQSKQGEGPNPPALLHFAALSAQQSYQGQPPPGAYQAAQAAAAQQLSENPSPVIPYQQQVQQAVKLSPAQSQFHTDMTQLTGTVANSKKRRKAPASSSRKLSAWQAYAHAHAQGINISVSMHAKQLSDQWKALPPEEKEKYANLAVELQAQRGPIVRKQKRVQTGKIYQKLKDAIDKIVHQHHTQQQTIRAHNISQQQQLQLATLEQQLASAGTTQYHCFDDSHQILTNHGWVGYDAIKATEQCVPGHDADSTDPAPSHDVTYDSIRVATRFVPDPVIGDVGMIDRMLYQPITSLTCYETKIGDEMVEIKQQLTASEQYISQQQTIRASVLHMINTPHPIPHALPPKPDSLLDGTHGQPVMMDIDGKATPRYVCGDIDVATGIQCANHYSSNSVRSHHRSTSTHREPPQYHEFQCKELDHTQRPCYKSFKTKQELATHKGHVHKHSPGHRYQCPYCDYHARHQQNVTQHILASSDPTHQQAKQVLNTATSHINQRISLRVTSNHRILYRDGPLGDGVHPTPTGFMTAAEWAHAPTAPPLVLSAAGGLDISEYEGVVPVSKAHVRPDLAGIRAIIDHVSDDPDTYVTRKYAFLQLHGFFCGDGTLYHWDTPSKMNIVWTQFKRDGLLWCESLLQQLGYEVGTHYYFIYDTTFQRQPGMDHLYMIRASDNATCRGISLTASVTRVWAPQMLRDWKQHYVDLAARVPGVVASAKYIPAWVKYGLAKLCSRYWLHGMWVADGNVGTISSLTQHDTTGYAHLLYGVHAGTHAIFTSSVHERDDLQVIMAHAGFMSWVDASHAAGHVSGINTRGEPITATTQKWGVYYREVNNNDGYLTHHDIHVTTCTKSERVWCVTVPNGMILVRRMVPSHDKQNKDGTPVMVPSKPIWIGNSTAGTTAASAAAATAAAMANQRVEPSDLHIAVLVFHGNSQHAEMMTYGTPSLASFYNDPHIHDIARAHASGWSFANTAPILPPLMQPPPGMPGYLPQDPNQHPHGPPPGMHMMQMPMGMGGVPMTTMQQTGATVTPGEPTPGQPTDATQQQQQQAPQAQPPQQQQQPPPPQPQQG